MTTPDATRTDTLARAEVPDDADALPTEVDALVVGGGPAGLAAATWLGRYRRTTLVVDAGEHRNRWVEVVHGVLGADPVAPEDLLARAHGDLDGYPTVHRHHGWVEELIREEGGFCAVVDGRPVDAKRIVLATGVRDEFPEVGGFHDHYGIDVFHCPACEGYDATDRAVAVIGNGEHVPPFAVQLLDTARSVHVVTDVDDPAHADITAQQRERLAGHGVPVTDAAIDRLVGDPGELRGLALADDGFVDADMVFFSIAHHPVVDLARLLGCNLTAEGLIDTDGEGRTCVDGVFAAGDVTPGMQLVSVAAAEGAVAGITCATSLRGEATTAASRPSAPDPDELAADA